MMEFKYINDKNKTPKTKFSNVQCDNSFRTLDNFSTPPSRFAKIFNPFENHQAIEQLHLPTFSPSVFAKVSTPKNEGNFKWTIDDISQLKPANIDEDTLNQHVFEEDPHIESIVQQKIDKFFSEKVIVPSPMTEVVRVPLVHYNLYDKPESTPSPQKFQEQEVVKSTEAYTQTVLTLPPKLPTALENALKPYFTYTSEQQHPQHPSSIENTSLYQNLFDFESNVESPQDINTTGSSIAPSTGLSPIQFSPIPSAGKESLSFDSEGLELKECPLSPIFRGSLKDSRSVCRLDFSSIGMSVDTSMVVPDVNAQNMLTQSLSLEENPSPPNELLSESAVNWDMEYKHVSLVSPSLSPKSDKMDISHSTTPHSKIFTSQRKRLSDSFKDENKENKYTQESTRQNRKLFKDDITDAGYHTVSGTTYEESCLSMHVFASTPSKRKN